MQIEIIKFTVPGQPQGKGRAKASRFGNHIKMHTPEATVAYENWIKQNAIAALTTVWVPTEKQITAYVRMYYKRPKSGSKKLQADRESGVVRPTTKPDIDNVLKAVFDSLNSIVYKDDSQIVSVNAEKWYSDTPRVVVELFELTHVGL